MRFGKYKILKIQVRVVLEGFQIVSNVGILQLKLECDNAIPVELILDGNATNRQRHVRTEINPSAVVSQLESAASTCFKRSQYNCWSRGEDWRLAP